MKKSQKAQSVVWFRRDLRIADHVALFFALTESSNVLPIFIFDKNILQSLAPDDARVTFIYDAVMKLRQEIRKNGGDLCIYFDTPESVFIQLVKQFGQITLYVNEDYEPYAITRDHNVKNIIEKVGGEYRSYTDHVIFAPGSIVKSDGQPYTIYTPYSRRWLTAAEELSPYGAYPSEKYGKNFLRVTSYFDDISLSHIGFVRSKILVPPYCVDQELLHNYAKTRDYPAHEHGTSRIGPYLRFGLVSIREVVRLAVFCHDNVFLKELIWREFFQMIMYYYPHSITASFKKQYDHIAWKNDMNDFDAWCNGQTGYPFVDAGMRELVATGYMHNRVRMVVASFLCKHLLIDWQWGERYFAQHLLDYELASNVGNWQWAAGSGCDAAPYFRVFNPTIQMKKFDPDGVYIKQWVPEYGTQKYVQPMVEHAFARERAIMVYKTALQKTYGK